MFTVHLIALWVVAYLSGVTRAWIQVRFTRDLILRENFDTQILPNSRRFLNEYATCLLAIHFMMLLEELALPKFLRIR